MKTTLGTFLNAHGQLGSRGPATEAPPPKHLEQKIADGRVFSLDDLRPAPGQPPHPGALRLFLSRRLEAAGLDPRLLDTFARDAVAQTFGDNLRSLHELLVDPYFVRLASLRLDDPKAARQEILNDPQHFAVVCARGDVPLAIHRLHEAWMDGAIDRAKFDGAVKTLYLGAIETRYGDHDFPTIADAVAQSLDLSSVPRGEVDAAKERWAKNALDRLKQYDPPLEDVRVLAKAIALLSREGLVDPRTLHDATVQAINSMTIAGVDAVKSEKVMLLWDAIPLRGESVARFERHLKRDLELKLEALGRGQPVDVLATLRRLERNPFPGAEASLKVLVKAAKRGHARALAEGAQYIAGAVSRGSFGSLAQTALAVFEKEGILSQDQARSALVACAATALDRFARREELERSSLVGRFVLEAHPEIDWKNIPEVAKHTFTSAQVREAVERYVTTGEPGYQRYRRDDPEFDPAKFLDAARLFLAHVEGRGTPRTAYDLGWEDLRASLASTRHFLTPEFHHLSRLLGDMIKARAAENR